MYIPIEDTTTFRSESRTMGVKQALLIDIAGLAQTLHYTGASYDVKRDEIILQKGPVQSRPLGVSTDAELRNIYFILYFEAQVQCDGMSAQLVARLDSMEKRLKALEENNLELQKKSSTVEPAATDPIIIETIAREVVQPAPAVATPTTTTVTPTTAPAANEASTVISAAMVVVTEPVRDRFYGGTTPSLGGLAATLSDEDPGAELMRLRKQVIQMGGMLTANGDVATYSRPRELRWSSALEPNRSHDGHRVKFVIPDDFAAMRRFFAHDQYLLAQMCVESRAS